MKFREYLKTLSGKELTQKEKVDLWCRALESGEYAQGVESLQNGDCYCCLGVLSDIYEIVAEDDLPRDVHGDYDEAILAGKFEKVREWINLNTNEGRLDEPLVFREITPSTLAALNDAGMEFKELAEVISSNEYLFVE